MASGENCADPFVVTGATQVFARSTQDAGNDLIFTDSTSTTCEGNSSVTASAGDHVYRVTVPSGERVVASLDAPSFDTILNIVAGQANCGAPNPDGGLDRLGVVCAARADDPQPSTIKYRNTSGSPVDAFILVDGYSTGRGNYSLSVNVGAMPMGDDCDVPAPLVSGTPLTGQSLAPNSGFASDYTGSGTGCSATSEAIDRVYSINVPGGNRANLTVTPSASMNTSISLAANAAACGSRTCLANSNTGGAGVADTLTWVNPSPTAAQNLLVIVDTSTAAGGTFDISAVVEPLPMGDSCGTAVAISGTTNLTGQSILGYTNDYTAGAGCVIGSSAADRVYQVNVPAGNRLTASVTPDVFTASDGGMSPTFDPAINVVSAATCSATLTCVLGANASGGATDTVIFDNPTTAAQSVFVVVDTSTTAPVGAGTFGLNVTVAPVTFPTGEVCTSTAAPISTSTVLSNQNFTGYANNYTSNGQTVCRYGVGADRAYTVDVPVGQVLTVRAAPVDGGMSDGGTVDVALSLVDSMIECGSGPCLSGSDTTGNTTEIVTQSNVGGTATRRMLVVVDTKASGVGPFNLDVAIAAPPAGDVCTNTAAPLTATTTLATESLVAYVNDFSGSTPSTGCAFGSGQDRVYAVTIPAMNRMSITTQATGSGDLAINVVDGPATACSANPLVCARNADATFGGGTESLVFDNTTGQPKTVFVIIDRFGTAAGTETFSFGLTLGAIPAAPPGETCSMPIQITASGTTTGQTTVGYANDVQTVLSCTTYETVGPDRVYEVTVGAGQTLNATVTPVSSWDPGIYLIQGPAANCLATGSTCLNGDDSDGTGTAETATYTNSTQNPVTVFIVVDGYTSTTSGTYDLTVSLMP